MDVLDLSKKFELNLAKAGFTQIPIMKTRLTVDRSGSMERLYQTGWVKQVVHLFLGAAIKFDDNGELEFNQFNGDVTGTQSINLSNYGNMKLKDAGGGTNYLPALKSLCELPQEEKKPGLFGKIFGSSKTESTVKEPPVYLGFITDGDAGDTRDALQFVESLKGTRNFIQFIAIGSGVNENVLKALSKNDNVSYNVIVNPQGVTVDEFYEQLCNQKLLKWIETL